MTPNKTELRQALSRVRETMTDNERVAKSEAIFNELKKTMDWDEVVSIHCFETIKSKGEVITESFIDFILDEFQDIDVYTSRRIGDNWEVVTINGDKPERDLDLDLIIVPMLGFDEELNRIGYGGGYYDRLLEAYPDSTRAGVCFASGKVEHIPTEPHDIKLDIILTETDIYATA